ncbi:MAG: RNA polymerase sigma factor [Desulfobacterales bacterium]|jgi:RNA polymerase sigma-70 factor (ECF subfamily)|nr:RNA polymerase sigma factor [Desulfobacterales bacterium]
MAESHPPNRPAIHDSDTELIQAINSGREDLFPELVRRYEQRLYTFGRRMCGNPADAEDLVQETFLNVLRYLKDFRYETKFKNWLYRVAASTCLKQRRKSKFAPERQESLETLEPEAAAVAADSVPKWVQMPLEKLLNEELAQTLQHAIHSLPEAYRLVVVLRDMEGFSTEEAARILTISDANVKVRLHRARLFLREKLKGYFDHGL